MWLEQGKDREGQASGERPGRVKNNAQDASASRYLAGKNAYPTKGPLFFWIAA